MYVCMYVCMYVRMYVQTLAKTCIHKYSLIHDVYIYIYGYGSKNPLDRPAVIRTSGTRGLRKGA